MTERLGRRIAVVGTTGAGKTTMARRLAELLDLRHVELDALHWEPNWTPATTDALRARVANALSGDAWITDGNYGMVRDLIWKRVEVIIWLDYPLAIILANLSRRTSRRVLTGEVLWNGNRERIQHVFSRDSIFIWAVQTYTRRRREYAELLQQPEHANLAVVHLHSPRQARKWLAAVAENALKAR